MVTQIDRLSRGAREANASARRIVARRLSRARGAALAAVLGFGLMLANPPARAAQSGDLIGEMHDYYTWSLDEDMLDIARAEELGLIALMVANPGVDPWLPQRGVHLVLPTMHILPDAPRKGIVINTAELRLYYFDAEDGYLSFPLGVGRDGYLTPTGTTKIVRKKDHPSWTLTPSEVRDHPELPKVVPPGEDNPLGEYAMYLGWPTYLIHGTNTPWGIGRRTSRGCIRMYPEDIEWLFERVPVGTQVTVVDQPVKLGWKDDELYVEVEPSTMQVDKMEETSKSPGPPDPIPLAAEADRILAKAGEAAFRLDWPVIEKALADRQGYPIRITLAQAAPAAVDAPATAGAPTAGAPTAGVPVGGAPAGGGAGPTTGSAAQATQGLPAPAQASGSGPTSTPPSTAPSAGAAPVGAAVSTQQQDRDGHASAPVPAPTATPRPTGTKAPAPPVIVKP